MKDTLYLSAYTGNPGILKVYGDSWEIKETGDWFPEHIWKAGNSSYVGSDKLCEFDGNEFKYFEAVDSFLSENNSKVSAFGYERENNLWIGTDTGYLLNVLNGKINSVLHPENDEIVDIIIDRNNNKWMIIKNIGVYVYNENTIVSVKENEDNTPSSFELKQNHPNPFNPSTTINYTLPSSGSVQIKGVRYSRKGSSHTC